MGSGLWEVRSSLDDRIARVFFIIVSEEIILHHGTIKKSRTAPKQELELARKRQSIYVQASDSIHETKRSSKRPPRK